jgi:hypothetical protein
MTRALTTFAYGPQAALLDVSLPTFNWYAERHGYDLYVPSKTRFAGVSRPYSWCKIPLLISLMESGYDEVLWLDADVVVCRYDKDIFDDASDAPMSVVVHRTEDGDVPNMGVWVVRKSCLPFLRSLWHRDGFSRSECWWEQAAVIAALGGDPDATPVAVPAGPAWGQLPYEWNPHRNDVRGIPDDCRFFHATTFSDRRAAMLGRAQSP